jgi:tetratricopeptide (TPR) repeat protein
MINNYKQAAKLNNEGVSLLEESDTQRALQIFQQSLALMRRTVNDIEDNDSKEHMGNNLESFTYPLRQSPITLPNLQSGNFYIYNGAVFLPEDLAISEDEDFQQVLAVFSSIILLNLALAFHLDGKCSGREASLKKAGRLYQMVLQLLNETESTDTEVAVLALLAFNNMAHIHFEHCDYESCRACLESVFGLVESLPSLHTSLSEAEVQGLTLNIVLFSPTLLCRGSLMLSGLHSYHKI